jgi:putative transposase
MYDWRYLSEKDRKKVLKERKSEHRPWHAPPRFEYGDQRRFIVTAACYEHQRIIGTSSNRLSECEVALLDVCAEFCEEIFAWCVLHNHYHVLVDTERIREFQLGLGKFHGRMSHKWNGEDGQRGRKVWYRSFERPIESVGHFFASLNYIHHNPVKHGYVDRWQDWEFSSARQFLRAVGRDKALEIWREHPVMDYGKEWDAN